MRNQAALFNPVSRCPGAEEHNSSPAVGASRSYPSYRPSGVEWLGDVPAHWRTKRLKYAVDLINQKTEDADGLPYVGLEHIESWTGRRIESETPVEPEGIANSFRVGDVLFGKLRPYLAKAMHARDAGVCTSEALVLRPRLVVPEYLLYYALNRAFVSVVDGSTYGSKMPRANWELIGNLPCPLPPLPEQRAIAGWLDGRTRRIDELVAAKERLVGLLVEQRTTLITRAVTKGLNPVASMKPSGIDWIGELPTNWEVKRIKFVARVGNGSTPSRENAEYWSGDYPWLNSGVVNLREVTEASDFVTELALAECHLPIVHPPAVLVGITGEGKTRGMATVLRIEATINQHLSFVKPTRADCDAEYMRYVLHAAYQFLRDESGGGGSTKGALTCDQLGNVSIPFPPFPEQRVIVAHLDASSTKLDALIAATEAAISRLTEYRQALISVAVTGKVRVCEVASVTDCESAPCVAAAVVGHAAGPRRGANKHFQRTVLAAQIIATIGDKPTFGRVKLQKAMVLAEYHLRIGEIQSEPIRAAAGPFDNQMMQSVHAQLKRSQWYTYDQARHGAKYGPLAKAGGHAEYFDRYWSDRRAGFDALMKTLDPMTTEQAEIVATLYAAWNDFLIDGITPTDDALVAEVSKNWHAEKAKITEAQWRAALPWMRQHGLVPTGFGASTRKVSTESTPRSRT